ncbi:amidohydrolase family protein [Sulfurimonas sp. MAG313]|nr:amidohydrolase family protein [Sulfurimonas sp. MAG313]MDF1879993.1 amidohydrolase family protein [Sulfurimonas sp. MAG313]
MIIKNAVLCDANGERQGDVEIQDGIITKIADTILGEDIIDAKGVYLLPGLIDLNVSLLDNLLNTSKLQSLSFSALKGGVTTVVLNPELEPSIDNEIVLEFVLDRKFDGAKIKSAICGTKQVETTLQNKNITSKDEDKALSNIAILLKQGAVAPSLSSSVDSNLIRRIFEYMKMYEGTVFCSPKDKELNGDGVMFEGEISSALGLPGISVLGEIIHVTKMIEISRYFNVQVLFKGLFTRRSLEMISQAKKEGLKVFAEISIHHLCLDDSACDGFNTYAKIFPPLANSKGKEALRASLKNGEIDVLTSLHSPHSKVNKEVAFYDAAYGTESLEDILPLYYTKLVREGLIDMPSLSKMTSFAPAQMIKQNSGLIKEGQVADLVLFDTSISSKINNTKSLYKNDELFGKIISVFVNGELK